MFVSKEASQRCAEGEDDTGYLIQESQCEELDVFALPLITVDHYLQRTSRSTSYLYTCTIMLLLSITGHDDDMIYGLLYNASNAQMYAKAMVTNSRYLHQRM